MKRYVLSLILSAGCVMASAQTSSSTKITSQSCMQIGEAARYVAHQRDKGVPLDTFVAETNADMEAHHAAKLDERTIARFRDIYDSNQPAEAIADATRLSCLKNNGIQN